MKRQTELEKEIPNGLAGRIMPQDIQFEQAVIGCILNVGNVENVINILCPEDFYNPANEKIFRAIMNLFIHSKPVEVITVIEELRQLGELESIGGTHYITSLLKESVFYDRLDYYAHIVRQKSIARDLIAYAADIQEKAFSEMEDISDTLESADSGLQAIFEKITGKYDIRHIADISLKALQDMYRRKELFEKGKEIGITTGLADMNRIIGGWKGGELIVIAARPAVGKSAISLHFAKKAAEKGTPVAIFSLEMSGVSLYDRLILSEAEINPDSFRTGKLYDDDTDKVEKAAKNLNRLPIYIDDNAMVKMSYIRNRCRSLKRNNRCGMVVIDYLQLINGDVAKNRNRENEVAQMSREAKILAKELDIPVVLLSQLNRDVDKRTQRIPKLSDIRESGSIEQDADMVIFIYRPALYDKTAEPNYGELHIAKYRNGRIGIVKFKHNDSVTKIYDYDISGRMASMPPPAKNFYEPDKSDDIEDYPF